MTEASDGYDEAPEIETSIECPACGQLLFLTFQTKNVPYEGIINIQTYYCKKCYYKHNEIYSEKDEQGKVMTLVVETPDDLSTIIYRSPSGSIRIHEIEVEIIPGEESHGEITTVEGILMTVKDKMEMFLDESEDREKAESTMKTIEDALSGKAVHMTVTVEDPSGKSVIHSSKVESHSL